MKIFILIFILGSVIWWIIFFYNITKKKLDSPISTLETLQNAIQIGNFNIAKDCFSEEIQTLNSWTITKKEFYYSDYWTDTKTIQVLFWPIPIVPKDAKFSISFINNKNAKVDITYNKGFEKDMRIKEIHLKLDTLNNWKIIEIYWRKSHK